MSPNSPVLQKQGSTELITMGFGLLVVLAGSMMALSLMVV
jgi:hypothetical protein